MNRNQLEMEPPRISQMEYSRAFWEYLARVGSTPFYPDFGHDIIRQTAQYSDKWNARIATNVKTCFDLVSLIYYFHPRNFVEIGTGTGRTAVLANITMQDWSTGSPHSTTWESHVYTCDTSNNIAPSLAESFGFDLPYQVKFFHMSSNEMLRKINVPEKKLGWDFFFIDGRVFDADIPLLHEMASDDAIFVFDDFVGLEKGVVNAAMLKEAGLYKILILPKEGSQCAVGLKKLHLTAQ